MRAGRLRHRLTLQSKTTTQNAYGEAVVSWVNQGTVWGAIEPLSGRELYAQQQIQPETKVRVVMRYHSTIDESWRIVSGGKYYDIDTIINADERNRMLTIMCRQGVAEDFGDVVASAPWPNEPPDTAYYVVNGGDFVKNSGIQVVNTP
jgi:SPP1 family predicted phage head-tail adaptor